jgi:hypothetical protein
MCISVEYGVGYALAVSRVALSIHEINDMEK